MYLKCLVSNLAYINNLDINKLSSIPENLDLDIGLDVGTDYEIIGAVFGKNFINLYVIDDGLIRAISPDYFDFSWENIPNNWSIRQYSRTGFIEILVDELIVFDDWYEKYVDDDQDVLNAVDKILKK